MKLIREDSLRVSREWSHKKWIFSNEDTTITSDRENTGYMMSCLDMPIDFHRLVKLGQTSISFEWSLDFIAYYFNIGFLIGNRKEENGQDIYSPVFSIPVPTGSDRNDEWISILMAFFYARHLEIYQIS